MYLKECIDGARYPYSQGAEGAFIGNHFAVGVQVHIAVRLARCFFAVVQGTFFTIGQAIDHEAASAYVTRIGISYGQGQFGSHHSVKGITTFFKDREAYLRGFFLGTHHHTMLSKYAFGMAVSGFLGC